MSLINEPVGCNSEIYKFGIIVNIEVLFVVLQFTSYNKAPLSKSINIASLEMWLGEIY